VIRLRIADCGLRIEKICLQQIQSAIRNPKSAILLTLITTASLLPIPASARNISSRAGTSTAQFLKLEMGARHAALGGTYAAYGSDVFTLWGQPAAIAWAPAAWQVGFQHTEWFQDVRQEYIGVTGAVNHRARLGLTVNTVGVDDLARSTEDALGQLTSVGGTFGARDWGVAVHYGLRLNEELSVGGAVRYIRSEIDDVTANGVAADLGARWRVSSIEGLVVGASVTNVGTGLKYIRTRDDLPAAVRLGAAYDVRSLNLMLAADVVKYLDRDVDAGVGAEWRPIELLKLRVGYRSQGDDVDEGLTAGIGFNLAGLEIDYAYVPFGVLGEAHRVSAGYLFGGGSPGDDYGSAAGVSPRNATSHGAGLRPAPTSAPATSAEIGLRRRVLKNP
jgi:hypothetical protein